MKHQEDKGSRVLLIVEDEPDLREVLQDLCSELTSEIILARDGQEALKMILENHVDAILSDINMPNMTGLELLAKLRSLSLEIPFIILSGFGDKKNTVEALRLGAMDFLDKPFDDVKLLDVVEIALQLGRAQQEIGNYFEQIVEDPSLTPEQQERLKTARAKIQMIKKENEIRLNKLKG